MSIRYSEDFKKEVVKAYMAGNKSIAQIATDYNIAKSTVSPVFILSPICGKVSFHL